jgi:uncharacterized OB-fold protein
MNDMPNKPLPAMDELTEPFWAGAKAGRLMMQKCASCGTVNFLPKPWCIECGGRDLPWTEVKPEGTVYSFTISRSVAMNFPGWQDELPVVFCLIDLDDGARMYAQVTDCEPDDMQIGLRVRAYFKDISDEAGIPIFRLL